MYGDVINNISKMFWLIMSILTSLLYCYWAFPGNRLSNEKDSSAFKKDTNAAKQAQAQKVLSNIYIYLAISYLVILSFSFIVVKLNVLNENDNYFLTIIKKYLGIFIAIFMPLMGLIIDKFYNVFVNKMTNGCYKIPLRYCKMCLYSSCFFISILTMNIQWFSIVFALLIGKFFWFDTFLDLKGKALNIINKIKYIFHDPCVFEIVSFSIIVTIINIIPFTSKISFIVQILLCFVKYLYLRITKVNLLTTYKALYHCD